MQEKLKKCMEENQIDFGELAARLAVDKHTLTRKLNGTTDWTFSEIMKLAELFHIEDPQSFFYDK
jgi:plasmid maintenance system antidote protein VapI